MNSPISKLASGRKFNSAALFEFGVILEQNQRFERAKDPAKNLWTLVHSQLIKKPSAKYLFGSFALHSFAVLRSRMTQGSSFFHYIKNYRAA